MTDDKKAYSCFAFVMSYLLVGLLSMALGGNIEQNRWQKLTVDNPGYIAAVKSRILAERAVDEKLK